MVTARWARPMAGAIRSIMRRTSSSQGLAVAIAFHARMFNIGGEGQAMPWAGWVSLLLPLYPLAPLVAGTDSATCHPLAVWCGLGRSTLPISGETRQSHRDHDDHVQLHRSCFAELSAGSRLSARGSMDPQLPSFLRRRIFRRCTIS